MINNKKAFTLIELVITITIVAILASVAVPLYTGYTKKAKLTEGYSLINSIRAAQHRYYSEYRAFFYPGNWVHTCNLPELSIDARSNKYFTDIVINNNWKNGYQCYVYGKFEGSIYSGGTIYMSIADTSSKPDITATDGYGRTIS
ncbi:MAG: prepilin-type N-terminal cleavage/methylation domain-containing protein [Elusimicrobia bacterium]|nr:prepilin-type N-terminal cleavage/methylation domain-containing protein [Elusimicrobiota bacterium]